MLSLKWESIRVPHTRVVPYNENLSSAFDLLISWLEFEARTLHFVTEAT